MHISKLSISNVLGLETLELSPSGWTTIEGQNGAGKTSVLEAIKAALKSGHDATLLRAGAEKAEIVLLLDDGMEITKKISATASSTEVRGADGKKIARPADAIKSIIDMMSINPVEFLTAPKKDRVRVLLEAMPLQVDVAALTELSGIKVTAHPGEHALHVIETITKQVYDNRTGTNRAVKEKSGTIKQLREAMPDAVEGVEGSEDEIGAQIDAASAARGVTMGKIATKMQSIEQVARTEIDGIRTKLQADIDALKAAAQTTVDTINTGVAENTAKANGAKEAATAKHAAATAPMHAALSAIKANRNSAAKREQAISTVDAMVLQLADLEAESAGQTAALDAIAAYKLDLLSNLPIPGLEVRDGEIFRNDIQFDRLNTAQQVGISVEIAKLRAGDLAICCLDGLELLDSASLDAFRANFAESGMQAFVTRVSDAEFAINSED